MAGRLGRGFRGGAAGCSSAWTGFGSKLAGVDSTPMKFCFAGTACTATDSGLCRASEKLTLMSFPGATGSSQGVTQLAAFDSFASAPGGLLSSLRITGSDPLSPSDEPDRIDPHPASIRPQIATAMTRLMSQLFEKMPLSAN
jgi:hypothetical protein